MEKIQEQNQIETEGILSEGYGIIPKKIMRMKLDEIVKIIYNKQKEENIKSEKNKIKGQGRNIKLVMCYLLTYGKDECFPSLKTISKDLEISLPVVIESLKLLEIIGWIEKKKLHADPMKRQAKYIIKIFNNAELKILNFDIKNFNNNRIIQDINNIKELSKDNKEDKSSFDFNSNFSPIKEEIIKYFDLYKKLHPMAKKDKYYTKKKINKINRLCKFILNGFPNNKFNLIRAFIKQKNIPYDPTIGFNGDLNKLKEILNNALLSLDIKYEPSNKPNITSDFSDFLINEYTEFSYFFQYGFNPPKLIQEKVKEVINPKPKNKYPLYVRDYAELLGIEETDELISFVNRLASFNMEIRNKKINGYTRDQLIPTSEQDTNYLYTIYNDYIRDIYGFLNEFEVWLDEKTDYEGFKWNEKFFDSYMKEFNKWFYNRHDGTSFFISNEAMQEKLNEYLEKNK